MCWHSTIFLFDKFPHGETGIDTKLMNNFHCLFNIIFPYVDLPVDKIGMWGHLIKFIIYFLLFDDKVFIVLNLCDSFSLNFPSQFS